MRKIEILAPAGSFESLAAAINASCDAVYIGGTKFGARAYADNLEIENMLRAIDYVHIHDKKIYMTVNTLLKNKELEDELYEYIHPFYKQGLDAVIIQDVGVLRFLHEFFPDLQVHASTQMSLAQASGAESLKSFGVTRIVTSRELGLNEIKNIRDHSDLEIESFVHGALCYCYSGQCLMSSMIGGRSGNRGKCAQPCRMPYQLLNEGKSLSGTDEKYLLSPKDICTLEMIPDLIEAGIDSFKIEGRMKRPEYAAGVTAAYRKYTDKYFEFGKEKYNSYLVNHKSEIEQDLKNLLDLYNRGGFTRGYYKERNGRTMMSLNRPNHSGVLIGKVTEVKGNKASIWLSEDINAQDVAEIRNSTENLYEFTIKTDAKRENKIETNFHKGTVIKPGNAVYRTKNNRLLNELAESYLKDEIKIPISGELEVQAGKPLSLKLQCRDTFVQVEGETVETAKNQPMTEDKLRKQIRKTNDTSYTFQELSVSLGGETFVPVQKLNELRRNGISELSSAITQKYRRNSLAKQIPAEPRFNRNPFHEKSGISVSVSSKEQLMAACERNEVTSIYLESDMVPIQKLLDLTEYINEKGKKCYISLPHIFRFAAYEYFLQNKTILTDNTINGYILRNFEEYYFVSRELKDQDLSKEMITDYNLYVMNLQAAQFWNEMGVFRLTAPLELNYNELKEMAGIYSDIIVYGSIPLMVSAQCLIKTVSGGINTNYSKTSETPCCGKDLNSTVLTDRYQESLPVRRHCRECYNTIYNSKKLSLLSNAEEVKSLNARNIRLNFTFESYEETTKILKSFIDVYQYGSSRFDEMKDFTRGHFKRGVE